MDWKEILGNLRDDPELPQGEEITSADDKKENRPARKDRLHVVIDKKGRKGKTATIVEGFTSSDEEVAEVAAMLKKKLGVGGSARGGEILIQGDAASRVRELLKEAGYNVK